MSDTANDTLEPSTLPAPAASPPSTSSPKRSGLAVVGIVLGLGALGYAFYLQQIVNTLQQAPQDYLRKTEWTTAEQHTTQTLDTLQQELAHRAQRLDELQQNSVSKDLLARFDQDLQHLKTDLDAVKDQQRAQRQQHPLEAQWQLVTVRHLLTLADQALRLERDTPSAIAALNLAEASLRNSGNAQWLTLRDQISQDLKALQTIETPVLHDIAQRLENLANQTEQLPDVVAPEHWTLNTPAPPESMPSDEDWLAALQSTWNRIAQSLRGILEFRRDQQHSQALMGPEQHIFLKQNIILRLQLAKLALARHDSLLYRNTLTETGNWLQQHHPTAPPELLSDIRALQAIEIAPPLPSLSGSWQALQTAESTPGEVAP